MGEIRSALEIALEKTRDVQSDKEGLVRREMEEKGKRLFSRLREEPELDVHREIDQVERKHRQTVRKGFFDVALANLSLPQTAEDIAAYDQIATALQKIVKDRRTVSQLFDQLKEYMQRYLDDRQRLIETLRERFSQAMQAQEDTGGRSSGRRPDPASHPEFANALNQNLQQLQQQYSGVLDQVRLELERLF